MQREMDREPASDVGAFLRMQGIQKHFGGIYALRDASLELRTGEVHGLIGQNGSGKSTLLSILSGQIRPDAGEVTVDGQTVELTRPDLALKRGIAMVTQELSLVPDLTVGENVLLGRGMKPRGLFGISWEKLHKKAGHILDELEIDVSSKAAAGSLKIDQKQLVEVARAVSSAARVVVLDEATSSLSEDAVERLMRMVERLKSQGVGVVFVSHRMDELMGISDRITVLRDGATVASRLVEDYTIDRLVTDMLGREPEKFVPSALNSSEEQEAMRVVDLTSSGSFEGVSFSVSQGEIVGLVGLTGSGRSEILRALFGTLAATGDMHFDREPARIPRSPREAVERGLGYVPADRKGEGLVLGLALRHNVALSFTALFSRFRPLPHRREVEVAAQSVRAMKIVTRSIDALVATLSGGNQQKVLLSKWMATEPNVLLLDEPTRGVDVAAKAEIHALLRDARDSGMALVVSSSEIEELLVLCDRFLVIFHGRVVAEMSRDEATESRLAHLMSGGTVS